MAKSGWRGLLRLLVLWEASLSVVLPFGRSLFVTGVDSSLGRSAVVGQWRWLYSSRLHLSSMMGRNGLTSCEGCRHGKTA